MELLKKGSWKFYNISTLPIIFVIVGILSLSMLMVYSYTGKSVTIVDGREKKQILTHKNTVKRVLSEINISLNEKDILSPNLNDVVQENEVISIVRAKTVTIIAGGNKLNIFTNKPTVGEVLQEQQIVLGDTDKLNLDPTQKVTNNLEIKISKLREEIVTEKEIMAFKVSEKLTTTVSRGSKRIIKEGQDGQRQVTYRLLYEDNELVSKEQVNEKILVKPKNAVVEVGVEPQVTVSRAGELRYTREFYMNASAYTAGYESTRKRPGDYGYGRTATGMTAQRGVVAVDPRVIPLGSKLYIESVDGYPSYGYAVAADVGGAIKGNKIDLFYENLSDALHFGRRSVKVYVLEN